MRNDQQSLPASVLCGYLEVDAEGVITTANAELLRLVDRPLDDVVGRRTLADLLAVGDRIYYETHFRPALQMHGEVREIALDLVRPDGAKVPVLVNADVAPAKNGQVTRLVVFEARDRRRYEKELLRARRDAEQASERAELLAHTLKQTFVPATIPEIAGLDVAGAYRPAGDGSEVGGDFYDVFQISQGEWVVAVGDVCGKGVEAAIVTTFVRQTLRAVAVQHDGPAEMLRALNTAMLGHASDRFCTVAVLRLLRDGDRWLVTVSSGGHPLPLLVSADGEIVEIGAAGSLVGVLSNPQLDDARYVLGPGDDVVVFTDGVTEARDAKGTFGLEGVLAVLEEDVDSPDDVAEALLQRVLDFQGGNPRDDIAIMALRVQDPSEPAPEPEAARSPRLDVEEKERALRALHGLEVVDD